MCGADEPVAEWLLIGVAIARLVALSKPITEEISAHLLATNQPNDA